MAQSVLGRYPLPNNPGGQYGANTYTFEFSQPVNDDQWSSSLDHHFTSSDRFFARASYVNHIIKDTDSFAAVLEGSNFSASNIGDARNYAVGETHIFSPTVVNNFTFTLNRGIQGVPGNARRVHHNPDLLRRRPSAEPQYTSFSNITPGLGEMQVFYNGGYSTYNALQAPGTQDFRRTRHSSSRPITPGPRI